MARPGVLAAEAAFHLERARDAPDDLRRLDELLAAWRAWPLPELAVLVEATARRIGRKHPIADHGRWLATAERRDAADLDWLLEHLATGTRAQGDAQVHVAKERVAHLAAWPPDPRMAPGLLRALRRTPMTGRATRAVWTAVFRIVHRQLHAGAAPVLAELAQLQFADDFAEYLRGKLRTVQERLDGTPAPAPATPELAEVLAALAGRLEVGQGAATAKTREDFLREIWAAPHDDGLRDVFADWLLQHDDPRGRFIVLQLTRKRRGLDAAGSKEETTLLRAHGREWLGALEPVVEKRGMRFEGGFLYACTVAWRKLSREPALMTHPAWATVREYELDPAGDYPCDPWLDHMIALGAKRR